MAKVSFSEELEKFKKYLKSESSEDARRPLLYPLFHKLFKEKFRIESDACGADVYIEGQLVVEAKTDFSQWLEGFYQALHYHKRHGLTYNTIIVVANRFIGVWKLNKLPEYATVLAHTADAQKAPNVIGKENARKTQKAEAAKIKQEAFYWLEPRDLEGDIFAGAKNLTTESFEILKILNNLDSDRLQVNTHNFIDAIERLKPMFEHPIDAVHAFYTIVAYWDITSTVAINEHEDNCRVIGFKGNRFSESVSLSPKKINDFKKYVETQYIFTNEGSGLTVDYYFSRFDEVLARMDPEYVKQHGIFFTDGNLSKFALWFANHHFPGNINEEYIVFDPAAGSGNLVSSWRGKLKHKIVSELQPDLLRTIERRMKADPFHIEAGFTIIPKTSENKGLNFLDRSGEEYLNELINELRLRNITLDKPLAFLLNPPYKNTDENQKAREETESHYNIDSGILAITGEDAGKERYLAFLGQILNIAKTQITLSNLSTSMPVVMVFTPTSWLIPRPTYKVFRNHWDKHFRYHSGFIVTSNEFFKLDGRWPLAFTMWVYDYKEEGNNNKVTVSDLTHFSKVSLNVNWNNESDKLEKELNLLIKKVKEVSLDNSRGDIRDSLPKIERGDQIVQQPRVNLYRNKSKEEEDKTIISGFPLKDTRHKRISAPHGFVNGEFIGFMDDGTPLRVKQEPSKRFSIKPDRIWFYLDNRMQKINLLKCFNGPSDNRSFCSYDIDSAKAVISWYALGKTLNGNYPLWSNMYDIWPINFENAGRLKVGLVKKWYSLCFAFVLAENRCVVTKFEKDNPVEGAPEVFVDNLLSPNNKDSFWSLVLEPYITSNVESVQNPFCVELVNAIKALYKYWNVTYCKGQWLTHIGLHDEPYFKYFDYPDFLTANSGMIQIRKYCEQEGLVDMMEHFKKVSVLTKNVKEELRRMLVEDFKYFE